MSTRNPRLQDVLRAGGYKLEATGAPGDAGTAPNLKKAASAPAAPAGFVTQKGPAPGKKVLKDNDGNQAFAKSSAVVNDLVKDYQKAAEERTKTLQKARNDAKLCADRRVKAVEDYKQEQEAAALKAIKDIQERLAKKEAELDKMQSASKDSMANLAKLEKSGGETTKQVEELKKIIEQLKVEKTSVETELASFKVSTDKARDAAKALAETNLKDAKAEAAVKLKECEAKNASSGVDSAKKLAEALDSLRVAEKRILDETKELAKMKEDQAKESKAFRAAAQAACDALKAYTAK